MNPHQTELAYRQTAVQGATGFGLLIGLYDTMAGDIRRAEGAQRKGDIEARCKEINHALLVLGYLENWIDLDREGELARQLLDFYSSLRSNLIQAQAQQSAELFKQSMAVILNLRTAWQGLEQRVYSSAVTPMSFDSEFPLTQACHDDTTASSWSA